MNIQHYKLNLDLLKNTSTPILYSHQLDKKSRFIDVTLTANDAEVTLDRTMTAVLNAVTNNVIVANAQNCTISNNVIVVELTDNVLSLPGVTKCEVVLSDRNGAVITAQHFIIKITEKAINDKSKFEPTGSNLATEAAVAKAKAEAIEYFETELTDIDETVTMKINLKADKDSVDNAVAQLSKQIADNKSSADESISTLSQTVTDNKTATDKALAAKYNSSNIESGSGSLAPGTANYEGYEGSFNYVKNGKVITVSVNITKLIAGKAYTQMSGLPFAAIGDGIYSSIAVYSTKNKLRNVRINGSWLFISTVTDKFEEDEKINFIITYIRR